MSRSVGPDLAEALEGYLNAQTPEAADRAWGRLVSMIRSAEDVRVIADVARTSRLAHLKAVDELKELVAAIEGGPNPLLPVVMALGGNSYVISHGRGQYSRVAAMLDQETAQPIVTPAEFEARGPCIAALDPNGSLIVQAYWHDTDPELFALLIGQDEGRIESTEDDFAGWLPGPERIEIAVDTDQAGQPADAPAESL